MIRIIISALGGILYILPNFFSWLIVWVLGNLLYCLFSKRRRVLLSNFHHAFSEKSEAWRRRMARRSCCRCVEMGLFVLVSPFLSKKAMKKRFSMKVANVIEEVPSARILLTPHFSTIEALALLPCLYEGEVPEIGVIYRPLYNRSLEKWVKRTRERFGLKLLSRKEGFIKAMGILKRKGWVGVLFDQNAGHKGVLTTFFNRVVSSTELPDLLNKKFNTEIWVVFVERVGFWRAKIDCERLSFSQEGEAVIEKANKWLENKLKKSDDFCCDWLWLHDRWRTQDEPHSRFKLKMKRSFLNKKEGLERRTRYWLRLPNWLGDIVMALPLIQALRKSRPDAEITLLAKAHYVPLLEKLNIAENIYALPRKGCLYFRYFWRLRKEYPDTYYLFTNSLRGDMESFLTGSPQRFGMQRPKKRRPLLTHVWKVPEGLDEREEHQTHVWEQCFQHFGLEESLDLKPFTGAFTESDRGGKCTVGLIAGTENSPEKRWPIDRWQQLIERLLKEHPELEVRLFGTQGDRVITDKVAKGFPPERVLNLAGKTDLLVFAEQLTCCSVVVCNDTGGMHLANALGVPVVAVYGPTNPVRTGPVFEASKSILLPYGAPHTGGLPIEGVFAEQAYRESSKYL